MPLQMDLRCDTLYDLYPHRKALLEVRIISYKSTILSSLRQG